jgi:hypothetical protein
MMTRWVALGMLIAIELLRWLADMPAETATALTGLAGLVIAGGPQAVAATRARIKRSNERGQVDEALLGGLAIACALATIVLLAIGGGCAPRHVVAERSVDVEIRRGPPCLIRVIADGELVARVDWSKRCEVALPEGSGSSEVAP